MKGPVGEAGSQFLECYVQERELIAKRHRVKAVRLPMDGYGLHNVGRGRTADAC
jgi:hypothetical protein